MSLLPGGNAGLGQRQNFARPPTDSVLQCVGDSIRLVLRAGLAFLLASACAAQPQETEQEPANQPRRAAALSCEECPEFVAVPSPSADLRPITHVAKYELTWNNYIAAVGDVGCKIPNPNRPPFFRSRPDDINPNLEWFRIDWPINILDPADVDCYLGWLSSRIGATAVIPTKEEWRWFASAGRPDLRYPWGNDPNSGDEMLFGKIDADVVKVPWPGERGGRYVNQYLRAFKVGQGEPNPWGLHDLLGNSLELTSTIMPADETDSGRPSVALAGTSHSDPNWAEEGLDADLSTVIWDGQYAASAAVRVVLIEGASDVR